MREWFPWSFPLPLILEQSISRKYKALSAYMNERARRLWAAAKVRELGYGGAAIVHRATGLDPKTICRGERDLKEQETSTRPAEKSCRIRQKGGGRKALRSQDSTLLANLDVLIEPTVWGDPMSGIRWTCRSTRKLAKELRQKGIQSVTWLLPRSSEIRSIYTNKLKTAVLSASKPRAWTIVNYPILAIWGHLRSFNRGNFHAA